MEMTLVKKRIQEIRETRFDAGAAQKAKKYNADVDDLLEVISDLEAKLIILQADPERLSKLEAAAKIDPDHLRRLLALEEAVVRAGYCGMPSAE